jgi:hypothetical protein
MKKYQAISTDTRHFNVLCEDKAIGKLNYVKWFSMQAEIILDQDTSSYKIAAKGPWSATMVLSKDDIALLNFKINWSGQIIISTNFDGLEKNYTLKHKGMFKSAYLLLDDAGEELMEIQPDFKWSKLSMDYAIFANDNFDKIKQKELLVITIVHCTNYFMSMMSSGGGA